MLATGATEGSQGVVGDIMTALHGNEFDGIGHVADGDFDEAFGDFFRGASITGFLKNTLGQCREFLYHGITIEGRVGGWTEHFGKVSGLDFPQHDIAVGHRQLAATAITGRAGIGTGAVGADPVAATVEMPDGAAASGHCVDAHHWRAHAHPGYLGFKLTFKFTGVMGDVGRSATHVEADDLVEAGSFSGTYHANDTA